MSLSVDEIRLTNIQNPVVGEDLEEQLSGRSLEESLTGLVSPTSFLPIQQRGADFDPGRAKDLTSKGADINADLFSIDPDSYFFELETGERREKYYVIQADQGLLVTAAGAGAGFISPDESLAWAIDENDFSDIETILRGEFDLTDRTHTFETGDEIFQVPSWSAILEDGEIPGSVRETVSGLEDDDLMYKEDSPGGVGLWSRNGRAFKGRIEDDVTVIENFQELEYEIKLDKIEPSNPHLDILDMPDYRAIDADLLTEKLLEMATDPEEGIVQDNRREKNVVSFKKNSSKSEMQVLGIGDYDLDFTDQAMSYIQDLLQDGNDIDDLLTRLGRMVEDPYNDDRFKGHEVGYWEIGGDPRLYTYTPEFGQKTFVALAGSHQEVSHLYGMNPSEIRDYLLEHELDDRVVHELHDNMAMGRDYLYEVLVDSGHKRKDVENAVEYLDEHIPGIYDIEPDRTEYQRMIGEYESPGDYDRIDLVVKASLDELTQYTDSRLMESLDQDSDYNELHIDEDLSVNLRFRDERFLDFDERTEF